MISINTSSKRWTCTPSAMWAPQMVIRQEMQLYYCYYGGMFRLYVAFSFALFRHYLQYWNTQCTLLKDTFYTIYTIWNTLFARFTRLKYTRCTICTIEIHYSHNLHGWNALFALLTLLKDTMCTIYTIDLHSWHFLATLFARFARSITPYLHHLHSHKK